MGHDLLIRDARLPDGAAADLLVTDGRIAAVGPNLDAPGVPVEPAAGWLLLPGLVEAHTHLDKSLLGMGWFRNDAGPTLMDKIDRERRLKRQIDIDPARQSMRQAMQSLRYGSTHIRSHVDVDTDHGMWGIDGVMATRDSCRGRIDIELVAFPQSGLLRRPGTLDLMHQALRAGTEIVGGIDPCSMDRDPKGHLDAVFGLCQTYGRPLDIHLHEPGEMGAFSMELIFERTRALGMQGQVTISHAFCLGADRELSDPLIDQLAALDIAIMTTGPAARPAPPVRRLLAAGVRVCAGNDGIRDTWGPYGNGDMLERAMLLGLRNNLRREDEVEIAFDICTKGGAAVMRLPEYGLAVGCHADLLLVPCETPTDAVVSRPAARTVIKAGRVVVRDGALVQ